MDTGLVIKQAFETESHQLSRPMSTISILQHSKGQMDGQRSPCQKASIIKTDGLCPSDSVRLLERAAEGHLWDGT